MDMVPRISRAQKMDALSSMANIAGYRAVIEAAQQLRPLLHRPGDGGGQGAAGEGAGVGAGVAGLAAIGTATSLGAIVYAFDVRPEVAEQIESMGAEFVYLDFEEDAGRRGDRRLCRARRRPSSARSSWRSSASWRPTWTSSSPPR